MINTKPNSNCSIGTLTVNKKKKEGIEEPKVNGIKYDVTEVTKMINTYFHKIFTREREFNEPEKVEACENCLQDIQVTIAEVQDAMKNLAVMKAQGPDGISN